MSLGGESRAFCLQINIPSARIQFCDRENYNPDAAEAHAPDFQSPTIYLSLLLRIKAGDAFIFDIMNQ